MLPTPACDCLRDDHRSIETALSGFLAGLEKPREKRRAGLVRQFDAIARRAAVHFEREEKLFYPALRAHYRNLLARMDDQHVRIRSRQRRVKAILAASPSGPDSQWLEDLRDAAAQFRDLIQHHIADEEGLLFPVAVACLPVREQARLAAEMLAITADGK